MAVKIHAEGLDGNQAFKAWRDPLYKLNTSFGIAQPHRTGHPFHLQLQIDCGTEEELDGVIAIMNELNKLTQARLAERRLVQAVSPPGGA